MRTFLLATSAAALLAIALAAPAGAGGLYQDRVHADSFGNLVIHSPSGYKRIIVGQGHAAEAYNQTGSYYEPEVVYLEEDRAAEVSRCHRPPYLWKGRSHMYGLPDGVIPQAPLVCD